MSSLFDIVTAFFQSSSDDEIDALLDRAGADDLQGGLSVPEYFDSVDKEANTQPFAIGAVGSYAVALLTRESGSAQYFETDLDAEIPPAEGDIVPRRITTWVDDSIAAGSKERHADRLFLYSFGQAGHARGGEPDILTLHGDPHYDLVH